MTFPGPITRVGAIKEGPRPLTTENRVIVVEVSTSTMRGEFMEMEIRHDAAADLAKKLAEHLKD